MCTANSIAKKCRLVGNGRIVYTFHPFAPPAVTAGEADRILKNRKNDMDRKLTIMPCLDMINGRVVKGVNFVNI